MKTHKDAKEAAEELGLDEKTIHRWCLLLMWKGYNIQKMGKTSWRLKERDVALLKQIKDRMLKGQSLSEAVMMVLQPKREDSNVDEAEVKKLIKQEIEAFLVERLGKTEEDIQQLKAVVNHLDLELNEFKLQQNHIFNDLTQQISNQDQRQSYMENQVKMRDEQLVTILREIIETKKLVAATKENTWHRKIWRMIANLT